MARSLQVTRFVFHIVSIQFIWHLYVKGKMLWIRNDNLIHHQSSDYCENAKSLNGAAWILDLDYFNFINSTTSKAELNYRCTFSPVSRFWQDNLALSTGLIKWIGHRKEIRKLTFRAIALRRSESRNCGLCVVYHHSFFRN